MTIDSLLRRGRTWLLLLGAALGLSLPLGSGCCPETPGPLQWYSIIQVSDGQTPINGLVEVTEAEFVITYDTEDGSSWEVRYQRKGSG